MTDTKKLYSQFAIGLAAFFGAPLASSILIRRNFITLGRERQGLYALIIGIVSTVLIFVGIFALPERIIDKVPNYIIPAVYILIIYLIVEKMQGKEIKEHKENNEPFYSNWRAVGIGSACLAIIFGCIFLFIYLAPDGYSEEYNIGIDEFSKNEDEAMHLFDILDYESESEVISFIETEGIPAWKRNIEIIEKLNRLEDLPPELSKQNRLLLEYTNLRIETYQLILKSLKEGTSAYDDEIDRKNKRIDRIIDDL